MASPGPSLLYALLETEIPEESKETTPQDPVTPTPPPGWDDLQKREQALGKLYDALYSIIECSKLSSSMESKELADANMAIGKALAKAIRENTNDNHIRVLHRILQSVVKS